MRLLQKVLKRYDTQNSIMLHVNNTTVITIKCEHSTSKNEIYTAYYNVVFLHYSGTDKFKFIHINLYVVIFTTPYHRYCV